MKVSISQTLEVSEEQRADLARVLDGQGARKRKATRNEFKDFIWTHGAGWESALLAETLRAEGKNPDPVPGPVAVDEPDLDGDDEDLLGLGGDDTEDDEEDLLG